MKNKLPYEITETWGVSNPADVIAAFALERDAVIFVKRLSFINPACGYRLIETAGRIRQQIGTYKAGRAYDVNQYARENVMSMPFVF